MTTSDDNDKTRIKSMDATSDKTQIANPAVMEERLRQLRIKKLHEAKLKEKKAHLLAAKNQEAKSTAAASASQTSQANQDKTRIAPANTPSNTAAKKPVKSSDVTPNDKTQFSPNRSVPVNQNDATRYQPKAQTPPASKSIPAASTPVDTDGSLGLLKGRFILESVLGAGGMGVVYKAKDRLKVEAQDRDPYVAVKVLGEEFKAHPEAFIALQRESRKSQRIAHPNIVNVHDFDRDENTVFMTMEFLDGNPLDKLIAQYRSIGLPKDDVWQILQGICSALTHAHTEQIIHSDFKPGNIFFTHKGVTKVFDFGIARAVSRMEHIEDSKDDKTVFDAGSLGAVTPAYASYEMLEGDTPDVRDDIYALGCIAYELFTGEHPYNRANARDAFEKKLKPKKIPGITNRQWRAIEKACALKREDRIATVEEFWNEMTLTKSRKGLVITVIFLFLAAAGFGYTQYFMEKEPEFKEDEVRDEIEYKLRVELQKQSINVLLETMAFTESWEYEVWREYQSALKLLGKEDRWLQDVKAQLKAVYIERIGSALEGGELTIGAVWIENASRYIDDKNLLAHYRDKLAALIAEQEKIKAEEERRRLQIAKVNNEKKQQAQTIIERKSAYNAALETVREQLGCRSNIDMKDLSIAIKKLRELDQQKYQGEEPAFVNQLALCLEKIGRNYPERAKDSKKAAIRLFPDNSTIADIKIIPRDPCGSSIAGLGAKGTRATCRDRIPRVGQGPALVVIPAPAKGKIFAIGKYEISVDEINAYCQNTGKCPKLPEKNTDLPAVNLSNDIVRGYLRWLSAETKRNYRLPLYSEWLHAAKARRGVLDSNRNCTLKSRGIEKGGSLLKASVGKQNSWGLVNHIGNAQELVAHKGSGYRAVGGSNITPMESCDFSFNNSHNGGPDPYTAIRVLREIDDAGR